MRDLDDLMERVRPLGLTVAHNCCNGTLSVRRATDGRSLGYRLSRAEADVLVSLFEASAS